MGNLIASLRCEFCEEFRDNAKPEVCTNSGGRCIPAPPLISPLLGCKSSITHCRPGEEAVRGRDPWCGANSDRPPGSIRVLCFLAGEFVSGACPFRGRA